MIETEIRLCTHQDHSDHVLLRKPSHPSSPSRDRGLLTDPERGSERPQTDSSPFSSIVKDLRREDQVGSQSNVSPTTSQGSDGILAIDSRNPQMRKDVGDEVISEVAGEQKQKAVATGSPLEPSSETSKLSHDGLAGDDTTQAKVGNSATEADKEKVLKLSPEKIHELTAAPESLLLHPVRPGPEPALQHSVSVHAKLARSNTVDPVGRIHESRGSRPERLSIQTNAFSPELPLASPRNIDPGHLTTAAPTLRRPISARAMSTPTTKRSNSPRRQDVPDQHGKPQGKDNSSSFHLDFSKGPRSPNLDHSLHSPMPPNLPLPPLSIPTYLQLELSSHRPSQLYIHRSATSDFPYESSRVKIERLLNFLLLPPQLEGVLWFGTIACFDAWLYTFTILPLRLLKSFYILIQSWATNLVSEAQYIASFVYNGTGRMWRRRRTRGPSGSNPAITEFTAPEPAAGQDRPRYQRHHRRMKSVPSMLLPDDKADLLKGALIICTCVLLLRLDASRMYHWIRGQAAIKLYVIYNVLEVCDRLFSAIGQDVLECLFSREALERKPDGHSKILRPFWLFILALIYTVVHSTALFYQVITLNVAFVEIKSTVFKKFEKENLFQLTCADIVERFQLWLMLTIIASRNIVETGGLQIGIGALSSTLSTPPSASAINITFPPSAPRSSSSILPRSFTFVPELLSSLTSYAPTIGHILGPFMMVLGSEMVVDWLKHAYISKFNNTRPAIYGRFLDVLAKDYYSNAFAEQNLTKRLGLPVIPLSCLFIRASVQTYHMFTAAWVPAPIPSSSTSLASIHQQYTASRASTPTSTVTTLSDRFDDLLRQIPAVISTSRVFTNFTTILIFLLIFLVLVACKLVLGMVLLSFSRSRYRSMKERERDPVHHVQGGRRVGGWGVVEVDDDKRRWIYEDDAAGLRALREREEREKSRRERGAGEGFDKVKRYEMVAKRIW